MEGRCQEKSYPGEIIPKRNRTQLEWVRFLWRNCTLGTISLVKSYPGYDFSREIVPIQFGYDFSWVRFLLGTISPAIGGAAISEITHVYGSTVFIDFSSPNGNFSSMEGQPSLK